jgi:hypothetical protein
VYCEANFACLVYCRQSQPTLHHQWGVQQGKVQLRPHLDCTVPLSCTPASNTVLVQGKCLYVELYCNILPLFVGYFLKNLLKVSDCTMYFTVHSDASLQLRFRFTYKTWWDILWLGPFVTGSLCDETLCDGSFCDGPFRDGTFCMWISIHVKYWCKIFLPYWHKVNCCNLLQHCLIWEHWCYYINVYSNKVLYCTKEQLQRCHRVCECIVKYTIFYICAVASVTVLWWDLRRDHEVAPSWPEPARDTWLFLATCIVYMHYKNSDTLP